MTDTTLNAPWTLHFDRDGTEDVAVISDADGDELVRSRHFWLPAGDDPMPGTLAAVRVMLAAPKLLAALATALAFLEDHAEFSHDANELAACEQARRAVAEATGGPE
jgi:hypothetical protein